MLAIGALAYATGAEFGKYMQEFYRYLEMGLQNFEEYQVLILCFLDSLSSAANLPLGAFVLSIGSEISSA